MAWQNMLTGWAGGLQKTLIWLLYLLPIIIVVVWLIIYFKNKAVYRFKVRVFRERENGKVLESNFKGGYIGRKNLSPFFRVKRGRWWWQYVDFIETPKIEFMDEDDRLYYKQIDVNTFVQMKRIIEGNRIKFTPVESDVKYGAVLAVQKIREALQVESTWKKLLPYFGLVILAIVFIISYALLMNSCNA